MVPESVFRGFGTALDSLLLHQGVVRTVAVERSGGKIRSIADGVECVEVLSVCME